MAIRLGTNPIAWSNDDLLELGGETPLETCLSEARQAGFTGIELGNKFPREATKLRPILEAHDLKLISGWYSSRLLERSVKDEIAAMQPHLQLLKAMGSTVMVYAEVTGCVHGEQGTPFANRPKIAEGQWVEFLKRISEVADYLADQGVVLSYHHHMGTVIETEAEIDRMMDGVGKNFGLLLDTGHLTFAGADPAAIAKRYAGRITHVHTKDVRRPLMEKAIAEKWSFLNAVIAGVYTVPGDGCVDFVSVLKEVKKGGYDNGWFVVEAEQDPAKAHPLTYAKLGHANLAKYAGEAGFTVA